jgi:hypothetical protein
MSVDTSGKAKKTSTTFRMECGIGVNVRAPPKAIWALLTNAQDFPRWNSTVQSIEGPIALGQKLALKVPAAPGRVFRPKVTAFEPESRMVWSDGAAPMFKGVRTFTLEPRGGDSTDFAMVETFSGVMLPMIRGSLPDFGPIFEQYAADLKSEAEK